MDKKNEDLSKFTLALKLFIPVTIHFATDPESSVLGKGGLNQNHPPASDLIKEVYKTLQMCPMLGMFLAQKKEHCWP